jgi:transcriptional regulator with GAF, ATPase, and Fis domain
VDGRRLISPILDALGLWGASDRTLTDLLGTGLAGVGLFDDRLVCVQANAMFAHLLDAPPPNLVGRTLGKILGERQTGELEAAAEVRATRVPVHGHTLDNGADRLLLDYLPLGEGGLAVIAVKEPLDLSPLVAETAADLSAARADELDAAITRTLERVGVRLQLDSSSAGVFSADRTRLRLTHQYMRPGRPPLLDQFQAFPLATLPWTAERILGGEAAIVHSVGELPEEAGPERLLYGALEMQSGVLLPLGLRGSVDGVIVFADTRPRRWSEPVLQGLRAIASLTAAALQRRQEDHFEQALALAAVRHNSSPLHELDSAIDTTLTQLSAAMGYTGATLVDPVALPDAHTAELKAGDPVALPDGALAPVQIAGRLAGGVLFHGGRETLPVARLALVGELVACALGRKHTEGERDHLRRAVHGAGQLIGPSVQFRRLLDVVDVVAETGATVLVRGEAGSGKELIARTIHQRSGRREGPLVKISCGALPVDQCDSELFGHVRGAFAGAITDRVGHFELADGGTVLLDEVGDLPLELQPKLLRVLQESQLERVGDERTRRVDVRVVATTRRDLEAEVAAGRFRQDLFYRLNVFPIDVPALRDRRDDILPLAEHFQTRWRDRDPLTDEQRDRLLTYDWPGNVRELEQVIELDIPPPAPSPMPAILREEELRDLERISISTALQRAGGRISGPGGAADLLGIRPSTLRDRMKSLGIQRSA